MKKGSVITIGVFDGVHLGHRRVVEEAVMRARRLGLKSVAVTFDPHPFKVLHPGYGAPSLISLKHRVKILRSLGLDKVIVLNFTRPLAKLSSEEFIRKVLISRLGAKEIIVGENFYFGKNASAGATALKKISEGFGVKVRVVRSVRKEGRVVSSSAIRQLITNGKLSEASRLLGRRVSVLGTVVKGSGIAKELGYPTANINPHHEVVPPRGVYAVRASFGGKENLKGMLNIGFRPTFYSSRDLEPTIEVHLFGFRGDLYNKDIEVYFVKKIRDERKFRSRAALISRIQKDAAAAKHIFHPGV